MAETPFDAWGDATKPAQVFLGGPAFPEALIALKLDGTLQVPKSWSPNLPPGTLKTRGQADYLLFHWPWSTQDDLDSHSLFSMN